MPMCVHIIPGIINSLLYLAAIKSQRQHAIKVGIHKLQAVCRPGQKERGGITVPLITHAHTHDAADCCIGLLWNLQQ